jgi:Cupin-like domain
MMGSMQEVKEFHSVDANRFRTEIAPLNQPAILRGVVAHWPAVQQGRTSPQAICAYLQRFDSGKPIATLTADAAIEGRFFYRDDMQGLNFERRKEPLANTLQRLLALVATQAPPALYIESTPVAEFLPNFQVENSTDIPPPTAAPRIWIGNAITVQTHFDLNDNIACVVAGRRRFTLFHPDQLANLYVGPFDFTLSGPPVSMVALHRPDFARYPKFAEALKHARTAELEPGDALYIPYFWWHHVESLAPFNALVNYWWNASRPIASTPFDCLLHAVLTLRDLPPQQREAWRIVFDHYIFQKNGDPLAHLAPEHRGMLGALTPERARQITETLSRLLRR